MKDQTHIIFLVIWWTKKQTRFLVSVIRLRFVGTGSLADSVIFIVRISSEIHRRRFLCLLGLVHIENIWKRRKNKSLKIKTYRGVNRVISFFIFFCLALFFFCLLVSSAWDSGSDKSFRRLFLFWVETKSEGDLSRWREERLSGAVLIMEVFLTGVIIRLDLREGRGASLCELIWEGVATMAGGINLGRLEGKRSRKQWCLSTPAWTKTEWEEGSGCCETTRWGSRGRYTDDYLYFYPLRSMNWLWLIQTARVTYRFRRWSP